MSNSSPPIGRRSISRLRITQLSLAGDGAWPDLHVEQLAPHVNVFYGGPRAGKSSVAQLIGHLMYGKSESPWRRQLGQTVSAAAGSLKLSGSAGDFVLRRYSDPNRPDPSWHDANGNELHRKWRLTISSDQGDAADSQTIRNMLSGLSPQLVSQLFLVDFAESPHVDWLLSEDFARDFSNAHAQERPRSTSRQTDCCAESESPLVDRVDRRRVDELVQRRERIASEIEQRLSVRRRESEVLQRELSEVDAALANKRERAECLQTKLRNLETERTGLETRLRYFSLDRYAKHENPRLKPPLDGDAQHVALGELDNEIAGCRQTLAQTQQREHRLRTELAQCSPDGTADSVTCLADGRATLGVLEQLLDDLDAEVSQLARASQPARCIGRDAHAKLSPVAELLRQQVYTLCGQITEQERFVRRQQLSAESRQLARVRAELGDSLDLLLSSRESLIRRSQLAGQSARLLPQSPVTEHCCCEHHGQFVQSAEARVLGRGDRGRYESDARNQLGVLEHTRIELINELDALQGDIDQLERRWENLQRERGGLIGGAPIDEMQAELERLESVLRQSLATTEARPRSTPTSHWRASDILAQLTDGHLVQIRLQRQQPQGTVVDRHGKPRHLESLTAAEHDQLYVALTLSLVSSYAQRGVHLPLILDEPFLRQDSAQAAAMVGVFHEFARAGHQLLVFTEDREAQRRFATLNATLFDLEEIRHAPVLRLATVDSDSKQDDVFYLTENSSFDDFPVIGADTGTLFQRINILSVADLLAADTTVIAQQLGQDGVTPTTVRLWQTHMGLMCHVPNLTLDDAQVLAACGIDSPEDLFDVDIDTLLQSIEGFLGSPRGQRFERCRGRYTQARLRGWRTGARRYRERWQQSSRRHSDRQSRRSSSSPRTEERPPSERKSSRPRKFYLSREQDVEDAPSIGPKTAGRLAKVGIRTIADLLQADPESTAAELDISHISAATIAAWQHQSRLVCQIPELRGYAAQLLVACGLTQPEQIAGTNADQLVSQVLSFCETKDGQRVLRSSDAPTREKIAKWVALATHARPLEAA